MYDKSLKIVQDWEKELIIHYGGLKFRDPIELDKSSLYNFIVDFIKVNKKYTLFSCDIRDFSETYSIVDDDYRSGLGRDRSIGDLFLIARENYDLDVTLLEVMKVMWDIVENKQSFSENVYLAQLNCADINKKVFWLVSLSGAYPQPYSFTRYKIEDYPSLEPINCQDYINLFS